MATGARRWVFRVGAVLGVLVFGLPLGVETAARLKYRPDSAEITFNAPANAPDGLYVSDRNLAHRPAQGFVGESRSLGYAVDLRVNSHSMRGPEIGPKDRERWLGAGDSFTFAAQVQEDEAFVSLLSGPDREVLNAGADSYGTNQALRQYQALDAELDLDGVLLTFFVGNDLHDNRRFFQELGRARERPDGAPLVGPRRSGIEVFLGRNSYAYAMIAVTQRTKTMSQFDSHERQRWAGELAIFSMAGRGDLQALTGESAIVLGQLRDAVQRNGDQLMVAVAPPSFAVHPERLTETFTLVGLDPVEALPRAPTDAVLGELKRLNIASCDLHPPLQAAADAGEQPYFDFDGHWTPRGHEIVAEAIEGCLQDD